MATLNKEDFEKLSSSIDKLEKNLETVTEILQAEFNKIRGRNVKMRVFPGEDNYSVLEYGDKEITKYVIYPLWSEEASEEETRKLIGLKLPSDADEDDYIIPIESSVPDVSENFIRKNFEIILKQHRKDLDDAYFLADQGKTITINVRNLFGRAYSEDDLEILAAEMSEENVLAKVTNDGNIRLVPVDGESKPLIEEE